MLTNDGTDRSQLSHVANETKTALGVEKLDAVADRGYFNSEEILACEEAGITVTLPKPMTSNAKAEGRFGKQDFRYVADEDVYVCPAGEKLAYSFTKAWSCVATGPPPVIAVLRFLAAFSSRIATYVSRSWPRREHETF